jgi:hypothetical protein
MVRVLLCGFILLSHAVTPAERPVVPDMFPITVALKVCETPSEITIAEMKREVQRIFAPAGIQVRWKTIRTASEEVFDNLLIVAELVGKCRRDHLLPNTARGSPLGMTHVSLGEIIPFCLVDCDTTRELLELTAAPMPCFQYEYMLGRALGRVFAHELYHILGNTRSHSQEGVAKARFTSQELLGAEMRLDDRALQLIRAGILPKPRRLIAEHPVPPEERFSGQQGEETSGSWEAAGGAFAEPEALCAGRE